MGGLALPPQFPKKKGNMQTVQSRLRVFFAILILIIFVGSLGFMAVEDLSLSDSLYFTIVTITTVGYGDIHPSTQLGRAVAILLIVVGGIAFLGMMAAATEMLINRRERRIRIQKLNIVIGVFNSELGNRLMKKLALFDRGLDSIRPHLLISTDWTERSFRKSRNNLKSYRFTLDIQRSDFFFLRTLLSEKNDLLLRLLLNANLLEHELFTDLIQTTSHLKEELVNRGDFDTLPDSDIHHLTNDVERVYKILIQQWLVYMEHLRSDYPYLFSFAVRSNPFNPDVEVIIRG
jgi:hypothetical protein